MQKSDQPAPTPLTAKNILLDECYTFAEKELTNALFAIWQDRHNWSPEQRNRIIQFTKEKFV